MNSSPEDLPDAKRRELASWLGGILGQRVAPFGVERFGQTGSGHIGNGYSGGWTDGPSRGASTSTTGGYVSGPCANQASPNTIGLSDPGARASIYSWHGYYFDNGSNKDWVALYRDPSILDAYHTLGLAAPECSGRFARLCGTELAKTEVGRIAKAFPEFPLARRAGQAETIFKVGKWLWNNIPWASSDYIRHRARLIHRLLPLWMNYDGRAKW